MPTEILQLEHEISRLQEVFYKKDVLHKTQGKDKKQSSEGVLSKRFS